MTNLDALTPPETPIVLSLDDAVPAHVARILHQIGEEGQAVGAPVYLVGGFVRDLLQNYPDTDYDLVVEGDAVALAHRLAADLGARVKTHGRFGTANLHFPDGSHVDLASARTETYPRPGALPKVSPSTLREDLFRRDFTVNAMALSLDARHFGELLDPFHGQSDLSQGSLRVLHDQSFTDDPTRIMRAARFEARFGFRMEPQTLELALAAAREGAFATLTPERFRRELTLGLEESSPWKVVERWQALGVLRYLNPELKTDVVRLETMAETFRWYASLRQREHPDRTLLYLTALLSPLGPVAAVEAAESRLRLSPPKLDLMKRILERGPILVETVPSLDPPALTKALKSEKLEVLLYAASLRPEIRDRLAAYHQNYRHLKLFYTGDDLIRMGYRPGPAFGRVLQDALDEKLRGGLKTRKKEWDYLTRRLEAEGQP